MWTLKCAWGERCCVPYHRRAPSMAQLCCTHAYPVLAFAGGPTRSWCIGQHHSSYGCRCETCRGNSQARTPNRRSRQPRKGLEPRTRSLCGGGLCLTRLLHALLGQFLTRPGVSTAAMDASQRLARVLMLKLGTDRVSSVCTTSLTCVTQILTAACALVSRPWPCV